MLRIGLDLGSTTLKTVVLNEDGTILYSNYRRHFSQIAGTASEELEKLAERFNQPASLCISGSAGMGLAQKLGITFAQEVYATRAAVLAKMPETDVVIELGGEDAKILFLSNGCEVCMNGSCAGGTGAFIDQMAALLEISQDEMNALALDSKKIYPIASRCGVFAKSDVQPLLNQGAQKEDISASIFHAVASQTIAGLAQGRKIEGEVLYLGGPLTFFSSLRDAFDSQLSLSGKLPDHSLYFVAYGAALLCEEKIFDLKEAARKISLQKGWQNYPSLPPLFEDEEELQAFKTRHYHAKTPMLAPIDEKIRLHIGVDAGSTTTKCIAIDDDGKPVFYRYVSSGGKPVENVRQFLMEVYQRYPNCKIISSASTGYGEDMIKAAFHLDFGLVETAAHFKAARFYDPEVDFIIDIGGQDIKCFQIRNQAIDRIFLNEACSSGCGSFLQSFAGTLGYNMETFSSRAIEGKKPVDLGSRCTVFMNSSVKQAQKDGACMEDIAAGLAVSVVKNALYKVIRIHEGEKLGDHVLVQGGTFYNDAVLRAFELELNQNVVRPPLSGLMGALGAALYAREQNLEKSTILNAAQLYAFEHHVTPSVCKGCTNHCRLTINRFSDGEVWIGGNQCQKPVKNQKSHAFNIWEYKRDRLAKIAAASMSEKEVRRKLKIGLPMTLNFYELLPFWKKLFAELGFETLVSGFSDRKLYQKGQGSIPSDTVCYPAKLAHGHIMTLHEQGADVIFDPCLTYNLDEKKSDGHYNCPVVAYYPEVLDSAHEEIRILKPYLGLHRPKDFTKHFYEFASESLDPSITQKEVQKAVEAAYQAYRGWMNEIRTIGSSMLKDSISKNRKTVILCGRPYHADPEVMHGIDTYLSSMGVTVLSEDSIGFLTQKADTDVLNQWTYHARLYSAADWVAMQQNPNIQLVQLVSFGCGIDAITGDEVRAILEEAGCLYTQLKIDEITNLGAVKIRLRSLFAAVDEKEQTRAKDHLPDSSRMRSGLESERLQA